MLSEVREKFLTLANFREVWWEKGLQLPIVLQLAKQFKIENLIKSYRQFGHLNAATDPLNMAIHKGHPSLSLEFHGLSKVI